MMDETSGTEPAGGPVLRPEVVDGPGGNPLTAERLGPPTGGADESGSGDHPDPQRQVEGEDSESESIEAIERPGKLLRIGSMVKQLLEEVRSAPLDEASRGRLREIYEQSIRELADGLSPDLVAELDRISIPFDSPTPSDAELRVAHAQLVGWLEGLFHGIQATLVAQQVAARAQLDEMRQRSLPQGPDPTMGRPGTYL